MARRRLRTARARQQEAREADAGERPRRHKGARGGSWDLISLDAGAARRGVNARLLLAMFAAAIALVCALLLMLGLLHRFEILAAIITALASAAAAVTFVLSARREELVHQLAHDLQHERLLEDKRDTDGSV